MALSADAQRILQALQSLQIAQHIDRPDYNDGVNHAVAQMLAAAQRAAGQGGSPAPQALNSGHVAQPNAIQRLRLRQMLRRL